MHTHYTNTQCFDILLIMTLQNNYHYNKTHLVPMVAPLQSAIYTQKINFGEFKFQTVKNIMTPASTYNGSLYLLMNKPC